MGKFSSGEFSVEEFDEGEFSEIEFSVGQFFRHRSISIHSEAALQRCSYEKVYMQDVCRRIAMPKCDFNKQFFMGVLDGCLLHIFRTRFRKNTSKGLLLFIVKM